MPSRRRAEIRSQQRLFDDFFKIDEVVIAHERFDGTMSPPGRSLVFERGDAAALLLLNTDRQAVIVVEQFRAPVLTGGGTDVGEDIRVVELPVRDLFDRLAASAFEDPKLIIAAYWLQARLHGGSRPAAA